MQPEENLERCVSAATVDNHYNNSLEGTTYATADKVKVVRIKTTNSGPLVLSHLECDLQQKL